MVCVLLVPTPARTDDDQTGHSSYLRWGLTQGGGASLLNVFLDPLLKQLR